MNVCAPEVTEKNLCQSRPIVLTLLTESFSTEVITVNLSLFRSCLSRIVHFVVEGKHSFSFSIAVVVVSDVCNA